jgi:uncharacterized membrane protein YgdD (TMEM256/DUF423 family)
MDRLWVGFGAITGVLMVAMAAYAAHGLQTASPATISAVHSAVEMQGFHALALLFTGLWARRSGVLAHLAGVAFTIGVVLFCGSIYQPLAPAYLHIPHVPMAAPTGGIALMAGWVLLGLSALRR